MGNRFCFANKKEYKTLSNGTWNVNLEKPLQGDESITFWIEKDGIKSRIISEDLKPMAIETLKTEATPATK